MNPASRIVVIDDDPCVAGITAHLLATAFLTPKVVMELGQQIVIQSLYEYQHDDALSAAVLTNLPAYQIADRSDASDVLAIVTATGCVKQADDLDFIYRSSAPVISLPITRNRIRSGSIDLSVGQELHRALLAVRCSPTEAAWGYDFGHESFNGTYPGEALYIADMCQQFVTYLLDLCGSFIAGGLITPDHFID